MRIVAFTLVELLVVIAVIAVLMALAAPAFKKAQNKANQVVTVANLKSIGVAAFSFSAENGGQLPSSNLKGMSYSEVAVGTFCQRAGYYPTVLLPYVQGWKTFYSPMDKNRKPLPAPEDEVSYYWRHCLDVWSQRTGVSWAPGSGTGLSFGHLAFPTRQILAYERFDWHGSNLGFQVKSDQPRKATALFADGSVRLHTFGKEYGDYCDPNWFPYRDTPALAGFNPTSNYDLK